MIARDRTMTNAELSFVANGGIGCPHCIHGAPYRGSYRSHLAPDGTRRLGIECYCEHCGLQWRETYRLERID